MKRVLLLLFDAVEVLEAAAFFDVLGWASEYGEEPIRVTTAGPRSPIESTFGMTLVPDRLLSEVRAEDFDAVAVPGGFGEHGYYDSALSEPALVLLRRFRELGRPIASICVGALPVAASGALAGRAATTYCALGPERREQLAGYGARVVEGPIVRDGNVLTSVGPATAVDVAFALLEDLSGPETVERIRRLMGFAEAGEGGGPA